MDSPGQNTGVGSLSLLQGVFPTQDLNQGLLHCRRILYQPSCEGTGKESACNAGAREDTVLIPESGRCPGRGHGTPTPSDRGAWWATVHGVTKSQTQLSNFARIHSGMHKPFGLPRWFNGKEATYQCRRLGFSPLEEEVATQVQYPCLENPMDRGAWWTTVHGVTKELDRT